MDLRPRNHERCLDAAQDRRLLAVIAAAGLGLWEWDTVNDTVSWDDATAELHGVSGAAPLTLAEFEARLHPEDRELAAGWRARCLAGGWFSYRYRWLRPDGATVRIENGGRVFSFDGEPRWFVGVCKDVTADAQDVETYRAVFENSLDAMLLADDERRLIDANEAAGQLFDMPVAEIVGKVQEEVTGAPADVTDAAWRRFLAAGSQAGEWPLTTPDGRRVLVDYRAAANIVRGRHLSILRDVTDQRQLEVALRESQKMEAIGRLAGGIAHDFNNLLTAISGYASFALERPAAAIDAGLREDIAEIRRAAARAASLTQQLLAFSRRQLLRPEPIDVAAAIRDVERLIPRLLGEGVDVTISVAPGVGRIRADASAIEQCLLNLAVNARDAMPDGGTLAIEVEGVELSEDWAGCKWAGLQGEDVRAGSYVRMSVTDSGVGIDGETLPQIFEPFFTTKEPGAGTGLGLAVLYGVVRQSGGFVTVYSEPGLGSTFKLYFPTTGDEVLRRTDEPSATPGTGEVVLLVEDEPIVRELVAEMLRRSGYGVVLAQGPAEAVTLVDDDVSIDVLLTDLVMPKMSGVELGRRILDRRPDVGLVYASGYSRHATVGSEGVSDRVPFLQKPFSREQLASAIERALACRAAG